MPKIPNAVVQQIVDTVSSAAGQAAATMIRGNGGTGFATLEDNRTGEMTGIVLVCLDPANSEKLLAFVRGLPGAIEGRLN